MLNRTLKFSIATLFIFIGIYQFSLINRIQFDTADIDVDPVAPSEYQQQNAHSDAMNIPHHHTVAANKWSHDINYRRAFLFYSPVTEKYLNIFTHFFFNSWLYTMDVQQRYRSIYNLNFSNIIDLIVTVPSNYSDINTRLQMPQECKFYSDFDESYLLQPDRSESLCILILSNNSLHNDEYYKHVLDHSYAFLNSVDCVISFEERHPALYWSYDYFLRSDDDVFVTPFLLYQFPANTTEFITGEGAYSYANVTQLQILNISRILGLEHCLDPTKCFNIGSTWYASPELILRVAHRTIDVNKYLVVLFDNGLTDWRLTMEHMEDPLQGFFKGVSLLYASDIAINHEIIANDSITFRTYQNDFDYILLDFDSSQKRYLNADWDGYRVVHVHVWHGYEEDWFNKLDGFEWNTTMQKYIGDFGEFIKMSNEYAIEWREWCTAIAFDLHKNLSLDLFDVEQLMLEKGIISEVANEKQPVLYRQDHIPHVTEGW